MIVPYHVKVTAKPYVKYVISFEGNASACVKVGDSVVPSTVVFEGNESVIVESLNMCKELGVQPADVHRFLLHDDGEIIDKGEIVARRSIAVGTVERVVKAKKPGRISLARLSGGIVDIRSPYAESAMVAGVHGKVVQVYPEQEHRREMVLEVTAYVAAPFAMSGGNASGKLHIIKDGSSLYRPYDVDSACSGKIVVAGRSLSVALYDALVAVGARGVIVGGVQKTEFDGLLEPAIPVVISEGWGIIPINEVLISILREHVHDAVYIDAGKKSVTICPSEEVPNVEGRKMITESGVSVCELHRGQTVQVFDAPYWGFCGKVEGLLEDDGVVQVAIRGERTVLINRDVVIAIGEE